MRATLLWLLVLWRRHAERSWRRRRGRGISGGRGRWPGEGAGKLRRNEDILLTLPSNLRNNTGRRGKHLFKQNQNKYTFKPPPPHIQDI